MTNKPGIMIMYVVNPQNFISAVLFINSHARARNPSATQNAVINIRIGKALFEERGDIKVGAPTYKRPRKPT
jgi:hypothetical protein